ncbi:MAG TPA: PAS domain S-box protein, partial [Firmicutes bacterium]|nr:PAS domain S-box protein [Bacillota bacterium]
TIEGWLALIHPEDRNRLEAAVEHHRTSTQPIEYEYRVRHKNGHWLWWLDKAVAVPDETGRPVRWIGVCADVTAQREAEEALRRSEEKYRLVSENIPVVVYSTRRDPDAGCLFVSGRVKQLTGYSSSEFLENPALWKEIIHPDDRQGVITRIRRRIARKTTINEEYRIITKTGTVKWVRYKATPMLDNQGEIVRLDGFMEDISGRKRAELSLQRSERELRVAHQIASCFLTTQGDEIWRRLLEIVTQTLQGKRAYLGIFDGDQVRVHVLSPSREGDSYGELTIGRDQMRGIWQESLTTDRALVTNGEVAGLDDRHTLRRALAAPLKIGTTLIGIIGVGDSASDYRSDDCEMLEHIAGTLSPIIHERLQRDAKELERASMEEEKKAIQTQLQQTQKMEALGSLAGGIAHEFNNLLATIRGYTELVLTRVSKKGAIAADLRQIKKASDRAADLTRQLLLFGRSHPMESTLIDINSIVSAMSAMLSRLIGENITIETRLDPQVWRIKGDRRNIEQVIMNLVLNAKEAMPDGGKIIISTFNARLESRLEDGTSRESEYVCLTISDTGIGMDDETLSHIFEPFFSTKQARHGGGLGLAVVHGIVEQHGGKIEVESEKGKGTTFKIYLPAVLEAKPAEPRRSQAAELNGKGARVLVVEDEESVKTLFVRILSDNGYEVKTATSCSEARKIFEDVRGAFDVLLVDVALPDGSGVDLANELKAKR